MEEQAVEERIDPIALFPEEIRDRVTGLAHLGYLTETVEFCGHTFVMETIRPYMKFAIAQALEPYRNTLQEPNVYAALHVAAALTSIDGDPEFCPQIGPNAREFAEARLRWITQETGWFQPTIDFLFAYYVSIEQKVQEAIIELHRLSDRGRDTSQPSPDFLTDSGPSIEEIDSDTPPSESSS